jgi:hypothetical protein
MAVAQVTTTHAVSVAVVSVRKNNINDLEA